MSIRSIPMSHRSLTGIVSSPKLRGTGAFESSLERDLLMLLIYDIRVQTIDVQPVRINWLDATGSSHFYTPDMLAYYESFWDEKRKLKPILYEVKYRQELQENWPSLKLKFKAAIKYAKQSGWRFSIITEREIRTPYLDNVKFLLPYQNTQAYDPRFDAVLKLVTQQGQMRVKDIVAFLSSTISGRGEIITLIWTMLARHHLKADLTHRLNQNSIMWVTQS